MYFLLNSNIFDTLISIFLIINAITTIIVSFSEFKKDIKSNKNDNKLTKLEWFKLIVTIIYIIIFAVIFIIIANKYKITSYITLLYYLSFIWISLKLAKKNLIDLTTENKMSYIQTTILFTIFFSNKATNIYINSFSMILHTAKEYLLILFLIFKLIFFIYCIIINFSIFISNLSIIFKKQLKSIKKILIKVESKYFELKLYNFYFSKNNNNKISFIIDIIIYILSCPFIMILYFIFALIILSIKFLIRKILTLYTKTINYFNNSSNVIRKTIKISTIISLLIIYLIITYNNNIFSANTKDIFTLLSTVILIPLIYDSIKSNK
ncbi:hypothetical protein EGW03_02545 [bacterium]|nr:hypothetical protein [bacterium]